MRDWTKDRSQTPAQSGNLLTRRAPCSASNLRRPRTFQRQVERGPSRPSRSSAAPPAGGTAGCSATLTKTPASYSARHRSTAFQSSPTTTGTIGVTTAEPSGAAAARRRGTRGRAGRGSGTGVLQHAGEERRTVVGADDPQRGERRADGRDRGRGEEERRDVIRRKSITSCDPAMKPPQDASDLENVPIRMSTGPRRRTARTRPRRAHPARRRVRLVDHQPRSVGAAEVGDLRQGRDVASIENTPSTTTSTPPPSSSARSSIFSSLSRRLCRNGRSFARESRQPSRIDAWSPVGDHRVARGEDRAERADVGLVAGREDERVLRPHPLRDLALEREVQVERPVEQARAWSARSRSARGRRARPG